MTKGQRYRYEMIVRVRDFGAANADRFPSSSTASLKFAEVTAAVAALEDHLTRRELARVEARRVKATTRAAVAISMKTLARTARRLTLSEPGMNPFRMPSSRTVSALLTTARVFIDEARRREARFVEFGLAPTFVSHFTGLVTQLDEAVTVRNNGRAWRRRAQSGIEDALRTAADAVRDLDVMVPNRLDGDPVRLGHWRGARRIEGMGSSSSTAARARAIVPVGGSTAAAGDAPASAQEPVVVETSVTAAA